MLDTDWFTEDARISIDDEDKPTIYIRPVVNSYIPDYQAYVILREFGEYLYSLCSKDTVERWEHKLVVPNIGQIDAFQNKLKESYETYGDLVASFLYPVDRLIAIHLANALIANGQQIKDSKNLDIRNYGPTTDFANCSAFYSITPLVSVYAPRDVTKEFGCAFAGSVVYDLKCVLKADVAVELKGIVRSVANSVR